MDENPYKSPTATFAVHATKLKVRTAGRTLACLFFLLSLFCGTIGAGDDDGFLLGGVCLLFGMLYLPWYANPFIFLSAHFLQANRPRWAVAFSAIATALAMSTLQIKEILINEGGATGPVTGYGIGFYLWIGCCVTLLATSLFCLPAGSLRFQNQDAAKRLS